MRETGGEKQNVSDDMQPPLNRNEAVAEGSSDKSVSFAGMVDFERTRASSKFSKCVCREKRLSGGLMQQKSSKTEAVQSFLVRPRRTAPQAKAVPLYMSEREAWLKEETRTRFSQQFSSNDQRPRVRHHMPCSSLFVTLFEAPFLEGRERGAFEEKFIR